MRCAWLLVPAFVVLGITFVPGSVNAQGRFDGRWSVLVVTDQGTCDRAYRYPVRIVRNVVQHADPTNTSFQIAGRVKRNGSIRVSVSRGDQRADGAGRLTREGGGGKWTSSKRECSGHWTAERREP